MYKKLLPSVLHRSVADTAAAFPSSAHIDTLAVVRDDEGLHHQPEYSNIQDGIESDHVDGEGRLVGGPAGVPEYSVPES